MCWTHKSVIGNLNLERMNLNPVHYSVLYYASYNRLPPPPNIHTLLPTPINIYFNIHIVCDFNRVLKVFIVFLSIRYTMIYRTGQLYISMQYLHYCYTCADVVFWYACARTSSTRLPGNFVRYHGEFWQSILSSTCCHKENGETKVVFSHHSENRLYTTVHNSDTPPFICAGSLVFIPDVYQRE